MKKLSLLFLSLLLIGAVSQSCSKSKTYAEQLKEEKNAIRNFIDDNHINVIDLAQFEAQDSTTNVERNEYVLFPDMGIYMQIVNEGRGEKLPGDGARTEILCRFVEVNIASRDTIQMNPINNTDGPEEMICSKSGVTISGTFSRGYMTVYGTSVPNGWLVPLNYVNLGRKTSDLAKVKLIVPAKQGQSNASKFVYPCFYEITYQLGF